MMRAVFIGLLCLLVSCAEKKQEKHTLAQAYKLLDKGENAQAVVLLENYLQENPENQEALILLSSAYLGAAGLDIYAAYGTFKDLIFDRSLGDTFLHKPQLQMEANPAGTKTQAPIERFLYHLDFFLTQLRNTVHFLDRFPHVEKKHWALLDEALSRLAHTHPSREISTYRVFLRIVYMKSYFDVEWVRNEQIGSRQWLCELKLIDLSDKILWLLFHAEGGVKDLKLIYPAKIQDWNETQKTLESIHAWLETDSPAGSYSGLIAAEGKLREGLQCGTSRTP